MFSSSRLKFGVFALLFIIAVGLLVARFWRPAPRDILTPEERKWLQEHPTIKIAPDPFFPPIEFFDDKGEYTGMVADIFALIEKRLGTEFEIVRLESWDEVLESAKNREIDGITAAQITPERSKYLLYTQPILDVPNVIITRVGEPGPLDFEDLEGKSLAITSGYAIQEFVVVNYPRIQVVPVRDDLTALQEVSFGREYATVVNLAIASYLIEKHGITNLRVNGDSGKTNYLAIASRNDEPLLNRILQKGLESISEAERNNIYEKWIGLTRGQSFLESPYLIAAGVALAFFSALMMIILLWNRTLRKQVEARTEELNRELQERKKVEKRINEQLERFSSLQMIDSAISANLDLRLVLSIFLEQVRQLLKVDAADVLLMNKYNQVLEYAAGLGFWSNRIESERIHLGDGTAGIAAQEQRTILIPDLKRSSSFARPHLVDDEKIVTYCGVPLVANGQVKGVLEIFHRTLIKPDEDWLDFLQILSGQAAIALDHAEMFGDLQRTNRELLRSYEATIEGLSKALDLRDKETEGHSQRVTRLTLMLARSLGMDADDQARIRRGALLHDIGKLGIPDNILLKPGPLTPEEWDVMRNHTTFAYNLLYPISFLRDTLDIPYCHHEKWDGSGYPRKLCGEQIPLSARIFALVDVWDALSSDRPYRPAWEEQKVLEYIREQSGKHFDPRVVDIFFTHLEDFQKEVQENDRRDGFI